MRKALAQRVNIYADNTCHRYGFENWRTIWAYRIAEWLDPEEALAM